MNISFKTILPVLGDLKYVNLRMFVTKFAYLFYFVRKFNLSMSKWKKLDPFDGQTLHLFSVISKSNEIVWQTSLKEALVVS